MPGDMTEERAEREIRELRAKAEWWRKLAHVVAFVGAVLGAGNVMLYVREGHWPNLAVAIWSAVAVGWHCGAAFASWRET